MKAKLAALAAAALLCAGCAGTASQGGLSGVIAPDARLELVREGFQFTEGPLPMADGGLLFTDLRASRVHRLDPQGNITTVYEKPMVSPMTAAAICSASRRQAANASGASTRTAVSAR